MSAFLLHVLTMACLHLFGGLGFNLVLGKAKVLHFGLGATSILCAYPLWVLATQGERLTGGRFAIPFPAAFGITLLLTLLVALLFTWLAVRLKDDAFGVLSIAIHLIILTVVLNWQWATRGALGIPAIPRGILPQSTGGYALVVFMLTIPWVLCVYAIDRSRIGRSLAALAEHPWHAESLGINRFAVLYCAFAIMGIGTLIGDTFFAPFLRFLSPSDFGFPLLIFFVMIVVAGKPGSVPGFTVATFLLTFLKEAIRFVQIPLPSDAGWTLQAIPSALKGPVNLILFGCILIVAVWWRRDVLFPGRREI